MPQADLSTSTPTPVSPTRRTLMAGAVALPLAAALPALAEEPADKVRIPSLEERRALPGPWILPPMSEAWLELRRLAVGQHANGGKAVDRAFLVSLREGFTPDDWSGSQLVASGSDPRDLPILIFGEFHAPGAGCWLVGPRTAGRYESFV